MYAKASRREQLIAHMGSPGVVADALHLDWIDGTKALALLWIMLVHWTERVFGYGDFANPTNAWPPLAARFAQLQPLTDYGMWNWPLSLLRLVGWMGDGGVQIFIIASGFGLTYSLLQRRRTVSWLDFVWRRLERVYPTWWILHLGLLAAGLVVPGSVSPANEAFWFSALGFRATPDIFYAFCPAWWFIGLILQLYAVYPFLYAALTRLGAVRFAWLVIGGALLIRGLGLWLFAGPLAEWNYLDCWSRGAVFLSRLPEFAAGMILASAYVAAPGQIDALLRAPATLAAAAAVMAVGFGLSFFLLGNTLSPLMFGAGAIVLLGSCVARPLMATPLVRRCLAFLSRHSLSLFLTHQLVFTALIAERMPIGPALWLRTGLALVVAPVVALALETTVRIAALIITTAGQRWGRRGAWLRFGLTAACVYAVLLTGEVMSRRIAPEEVNGWGERASLVADPHFGWTLRPSQHTRLRWQTYDYQVDANSLGFPGPVYAEEKRPDVLRVLTTGDAFTSAEGVDTQQAWPRLLEADLARAGRYRSAEVMNFAITGYGPHQYAAVLEAFVPRYKPDVIVLEMFVNDLEDVAITNQKFQQQIGFGHPRSDSVFATLALGNLYALAGQQLRRTLNERLLHRPAPQDAFLAMLPEFAADNDDAARETDAATVAAVARSLGEIKAVASAANSRLIVLLAPAGIQVCTPEQLPYYPRQLDLTDPRRFDLDRPQRLLLAATTAPASRHTIFARSCAA
ncbi:acyltransferase family protein [Defluviicoccus vanus]|uniref:Acyltransferase family protein n=1 Tax=Defluviicoccus vanus TaxID=111831 RepID=A0A7H1N4L8_9PROT|nr:acyltransferase family protein [Defluviicoccus vanus]QNT70654.1 acyltransferase family protein [Defluviicoccus vanus]